MDLASLEKGWLGSMTCPTDFVPSDVSVLDCTWVLKICVAYQLTSERPENAVAFPLIS